MFCRVRTIPAGFSWFSSMAFQAAATSFASPGRTTSRPGMARRDGELLDGLVGGAVLAQADRVVRPDVQRRHAHEGAEPDRGALVVGEDQERAGERPGPPVQGDAVHDRGGGVLADAEVQHPAVGVALPRRGGPGRRDERGRALDRGVVRLGEVRGAAPEFGHDRADRVQDLPGRGPGGDVLAGFEDRQGGLELARELLRFDAFQQGRGLGVGRLPRLERGLPVGAGGGAAVLNGPGVGQDVLVDLEGAFRVEAQDLLQGRDFLRAQGRAVDLAGVLLLRRRVPDDGPQRDDGGLAGFGLRGEQRGVQLRPRPRRIRRSGSSRPAGCASRRPRSGPGRPR